MMIRCMLVSFALCIATAASAWDAMVTYQGFTEPARAITVSASEAARITHVAVDVGDTVQRGDVLVQLDDAEIKLAVEIGRLQSIASGDIDLAAADLESQTQRYTKLLELADRGSAHADEIARASSTLKQSQARLAIAREQQAVKIGEYQRAKLRLDNYRIVAPEDGVIAQVLHREGEFVAPAIPRFCKC